MINKNAIVLAMFGTSEEKALPGLLNIRDRTAARFPAVQVRIAFTSATIRRIWRRRAQDPEYCRTHSRIPAEILNVQGPLAAIANLQDAGCTSLVIQPVHMIPAAEYLDLLACVNCLRQLRSGRNQSGLFERLIVGRPALGSSGNDAPALRDIARLAQVLDKDVQMARKRGAALVYMGHGAHIPSSGIYLQLAAEMRRQYPGTAICIATMNEQPVLTDILPDIRAVRPARILLKPLMITAGRHARQDMAGPGIDSWQSRLEGEGFAVEVVLEGLGEQEDFADIFVQHIIEAAAEAGFDPEQGGSGDNPEHQQQSG